MLFAGYETVVKADVAALPFDIVGLPPWNNPRRDLLAPFGFLFAALRAATLKGDQRVMRETALVLGGMKDFRGPEGLGSVNSRNCYVLVMKPGFDLARVLEKPPNDWWEGAAVWRWTAALNEYGELDDRASAIVAVQMPPYLLVSNDPETVFTNARLLKGGATDTLRSLTEWRDTAPHEFWMYRRIRFDTPDLMAAGLDFVRRDVESMLVFYDRDRQTATLRVVSRVEHHRAPATFIDDERVPPLNPISPRVWEGQLPLTVGTAEAETWFIVCGVFGFAVYL
jgi:hypothetical protein